MAQKQDILEQVVGEYLTHQGYFVRHNIKFKPSTSDKEYDARKDSVHSDIDVLAIHPLRDRHEKVMAVSVKSYQTGFPFERRLKEIEENRKVAGRSSALVYRELAIPKWSRAFIATIKALTGADRFTHVLAVTYPKGDPACWEQHEPFRRALEGNPCKVLTLRQMVEEIEPTLTQTLAATDIGRTLQLFKAAGLRPKAAKPESVI